MASFARINSDNIVDQVILGEKEWIETGAVGNPQRWIQIEGIAGIGYAFNEELNKFISPQPYASWTLNEDTCLWNAPTAYPDDGKMYSWNESTTAWVESPTLQLKNIQQNT